MVTTYPSTFSGDNLAIYQDVICRASDVFTAIIALYQPDIHAPRDWADITVTEATGQRRELQLRLLNTTIREGNVLTLTGTLSHYTDTHWADYEQVLTPDPVKRAQVVQFHATLEALIKELSPVAMALRQQERS